MHIETAFRRMFNSTVISSLLTSLLVLLAAMNTARSQTTVAISALKDNTLYENATGAVSNGAGEHFFAGHTGETSFGLRRGIIAFDIAAAVPAGATITSVTLTLNMSKSKTSDARNVELHRVSSNWGEGASNATTEEGSGTNALTGDVTWLHTFFNSSTWTKAGGVFSLTVSASQSVGAPGSYSWGSTTQMVSDVQSWLSTPTENFGWVVIGVETASATSKRFDTRENATASVRPKLSVTFTGTSGVQGNEFAPNEFLLSQNYPNPFNPATDIRFTIGDFPPRADAPLAQRFVTLKVYDVQGREVSSLVNNRLSSGNYSVQWDASSFPSGVYIYRLETFDENSNQPSFSQQKKMILIK